MEKKRSGSKKHNFSWFYDNKLLNWMENNDFILALRQGLMLCIPVLMLGAFFTLVTSFPVPAYQEWIKSAFGGWIYQSCMWIYNATSNCITLYVIIAVSYCFGDQKDREEKSYYVLTCIIGYLIFAINDINEISFSIFNSTWLFNGLGVTLFCCLVFGKLFVVFKKSFSGHMLVGMEMGFRRAILVIIPAASTILLCTFFKVILVRFLGIDVENVGSLLMTKLFSVIGTGLPGAIVLILLLHLLWFFGIHGTNVLIIVYYVMFQTGMKENMEAVAAGGIAQNIFTRTFFDVFVMIGGCGATLCLLLAMIASKRKVFKTMFKIGILPAIFNINEIVLFGLPVILNPIMLIPFAGVPLILMAIAGFSMHIGLVPVPIQEVWWTTPALFSGYIATGSAAGSILQVVLIAVGTAVYIPFVKISENYYGKVLQQNVNKLIKEMEECEKKGEFIDFQNGSKNKREAARMLTSDLRFAMDKHEIMLYYQPQVNSDGSVYGIEALLRWNHPIAGFIYPPLVIELARQANMLDELGILIIEKAAEDLSYLAEKMSGSIHMAVNISPTQFENKEFCDRVEKIYKKYDFKNCSMCFEVTEQLAMVLTDEIQEKIERLRMLGISFHMDDFGMGHSSMRYLQNNEFEVVKLDGSLVREILDNTRSQDIISGIRQMAHSLHYELIAEYVETKEQRDLLEGLGCSIYQGALYSLAVPRENLEDFLKDYNLYKSLSDKQD